MFDWLIPVAFAAKKIVEEDTISGLRDVFASLGLWGIAFLVFIIFIFIGIVLKKLVGVGMNRRYKYSMQQELIILTERVVLFMIILIGFMIALSIAQVEIGWVLGPISMGLGFAFKDVLANIIAGVVILTQKKFKIGDMIRIEDRIGKIEVIDMRTTEIRALDGTNLIIPNSDLLTNVVRNYTANSFRRISFEVGVHYSTPLDKSIELTRAVTQNHPGVVADPSVAVIATNFGDSAITLEVRFWIESTDNWVLIRSQVIQKVKIAFDSAGIVIPFPIRTLSLDEYDKNILKGFNLKAPQERSYKPNPEDLKNEQISPPVKVMAESL